MQKLSKHESGKRSKVLYKQSKNNQFSRVFEKIPIPVFVVNKNCTIFYKNREASRILSICNKKNIRNLKHLFNPGGKDILVKKLSVASKTLENIKIPLNIITKNSNLLKVNCIISPIPENKNEK